MAEKSKIDKVKKLLLKAGSTDSPAEAEALFVAAQKLMVKWRIEESQLGDINEETIEVNEIKCFERRLEGMWEAELAQVIFKANGCAYVLGKRNTRILVFGTPENVQLVKYFFETSREAFRSLARKEYSRLYKGETSKKNKFIRSFLLGACYGLNSKIVKMTQEVVKQHDTQNQYALALKNSLQRAEDYITQYIPTSTSKSRYSAGDPLAHALGVVAGTNHTLRIPLTGSKSSNSKIKQLCQ